MVAATALLPPSWMISAIGSTAKAPTIVEPVRSAKIDIITGITSQTKRPTTAQLKAHLRKLSTLYGLNYEQMEAVIQCESSWRVDPLPHNGISLGIAQFTRPTWNDYGVGDYEAINPYIQLDVMAKMWSLGLAKRWDCYRMLY